MLNQNEELKFCTKIPPNLKNSSELETYKNFKNNIIDFSLLALKNQDKLLRSLEEKPIIPSSTECISSANFSQGAVVQNYCIETTTQSLVVPPDSEFANVTQIQQKAQEHANLWLNDFNSKVVAINTNAKQYCNLIISYENDIDTLVDEVVRETSGAKENFVNEIGLLQDEANDRSNKIQIVHAGLSNFRELIAKDGSNFQAIKEKADRKYKANDGEMGKLQNTIKALEKRISDCNEVIIGGGVTLGGAVLFIGVGVLVTLVTGGSTTPILAAGAGIAGAGSTMVGMAVDDKKKATEELVKSILRFNELESTCDLLQIINGQLSSLITGNKESVQAVQSMLVAYQTIAENLGGIIENVDSLNNNIESGRMLKRMLKVFVQNGKDLKKLYQEYEKQGVLPVRPSKEVWASLFPYRSVAPAIPDKAISMEEYRTILDRKIAWQRSYRSSVYVPRAAY